MMTARIRLALTALCMTLLAASGASAQVFGTFSWQMQPYCNIVTLTITQIPGGYTIDGNDNQCGVGGKLAGAAGMALLNPDGTVGLEFTIVTAPSGKAVHVSASINPANGSGPWTDSVGNTGNFALGSPGSGSPRPFPASGIGASVITTTEIAAGAVGASDINTAEVQARVTGACSAGQAVSQVNANGTVVCAPGQPLTMRGSYGLNFDAGIVGDRESESLSFGFTLLAAPTVHWLALGAAATVACPGTPANPLAAPGNLCVYTGSIGNINFLGSCVTNAGTGYSCGLADPYGATLFVRATAAGQAFVVGSWAVTRP